MRAEFNVVGTIDGVDDILLTVTAIRSEHGVVFEVQQSIDDEGPADVCFDLDPEQTKALRAILA